MRKDMNTTEQSSEDTLREYIGQTLERKLAINATCRLSSLRDLPEVIGLGIPMRTSEAITIIYLVDPLVYRIAPVRKVKFKQIDEDRQNHRENLLWVNPQN